MGSASKSEERFEFELEVFWRESNEAVSHLYAYFTKHAVAGEQRSVRQLLNSDPLFRQTTLRALETSAFIVWCRVASTKILLIEIVASPELLPVKSRATMMASQS